MLPYMNLLQTFELDPEAQSRAAFWREMAELTVQVARFEAAVDAFVDASREFKANL
jgi:hypothetical protein